MAQPKRKEKVEPAAVPPGDQQAWTRPQGLGRRGWAVVGVVVLVMNLPVLHFLLRGEQPAGVGLPYSDPFNDGSLLHQNYWSSGGDWRVMDGQLVSPGVKNNPLWLKARLPQNSAVEFDARSTGNEGDIKVEIYGDGLNHQSGYVLIHGGWNNRVSIIARLDEHGPSLTALQQLARKRGAELGIQSGNLVDTGVFRRDTRMRVEANPFPVTQNKVYRWRIERRGSLLRWLIDGQLFMEFDDPFPLAGEGHDRFGFSSWDATLIFDNLKAEAL
ncbi:MAG: hypothetical protein M3Y59_00040 [Myxococcota bacterium]|nr:hypothetical protein [Myxococcota bacterium]